MQEFLKLKGFRKIKSLGGDGIFINTLHPIRDQN